MNVNALGEGGKAGVGRRHLGHDTHCLTRGVVHQLEVGVGHPLLHRGLHVFLQLGHELLHSGLGNVGSLDGWKKRWRR